MLAVTVLGCSGSYAEPGGACTGYLVQSYEAKVWLDAGPGTLANLQTSCRLSELDAVVITHAHPDHWLELPVVANALHWYEKRDPLPVYSNAHTESEARSLIGALFDKVFDWRIVEESSEITIGDQRWRFAPTDHYIPTFATRVDAGPHTLAFSSDTGPRFSFDALYGPDEVIDLALVESTFLDRSDHLGALHLSAYEAGELAERAKVVQLILTHLAPFEDRQAHLEAAASKFSGQIVLAEVGRQYPAAGA
jgi:ribonuclease BN (tRNA processing enzyme)